MGRGFCGLGLVCLGLCRALSAGACGASRVSYEVPSLLGACGQAWVVITAQVAPRVLCASERLVPWSFGYSILDLVFFV